MSLVLAGKYQVEKKIGSGSFGDIFLCTSLSDQKSVAVKIEKLTSRHPQLLYEAKVIKLLYGAPGLPTVIYSGIEGENNIMAMELLGPTLEELLVACNRHLSLKTVLMLADQMLCRLQYIHSKNFIHRDMKPENFLIGLGKKSSILHIIDFGLAKQYRDPKTHRHIPYKEGKSLTGTARYASINTHVGIEQSRRDDLEGVAYILIYLLKGSVPWQGIQASTKEEKYRRIMDKKVETSIQTLCDGLPIEMANLLRYARGMTFEQKPDYAYMRKMIKELFLKQGHEYDYVYDWVGTSPYELLVAKKSQLGRNRHPVTMGRQRPSGRAGVENGNEDPSCCAF